MAVDADIDVEVLKSAIKKTYASVSEEPEREFIFPTGRAWAEDLGYPAELARVPDAAVESFAGVANPWSLGRLRPGERVLDLGSGAGTDSLVAAQMVGPEGRVSCNSRRRSSAKSNAVVCRSWTRFDRAFRQMRSSSGGRAGTSWRSGCGSSCWICRTSSRRSKDRNGTRPHSSW